jgi:oligopeptide/dipeptide ABC transporter ATP-binding protein
MSGASAEKLLEIRDLKMHFPVREGILLRAAKFNKAVDGVSLDIAPGETLGLVGESGCGKSTLGRCIVNLYRPMSGDIFFEGQEISRLKNRDVLPYRQNIQMIFQDPMESLNGRQTIGDILEEPLVIHKIGNSTSRKQRVRELLDIVGMPARSVSRFPFEFSGGQRQRIGIARAIALNPKLLVCDEPVSALDVSIQSQILNLLVDLQKEFNLSYLFIAHDLAVVKHISDRIAIMYLGRIVETGDSETIHLNSRHPYTRSLLSAIPVPDPHNKKQRIVLEGDVPSPIDPPQGCLFHPRCSFRQDRCKSQSPSLRMRNEAPSHQFACHFDLEFSKQA